MVSIEERLRARRAQRENDIANGNVGAWMPRNDIPVLVNHTQDLKVLSVGTVDEDDFGNEGYIAWFFESMDNHATFNVKMYMDKKDKSAENRFTAERLNEIVAHLGVNEDELGKLKGQTLRAKVEYVTALGGGIWESADGKKAYRITNIDVASGVSASSDGASGGLL